MNLADSSFTTAALEYAIGALVRKTGPIGLVDIKISVPYYGLLAAIMIISRDFTLQMAGTTGIIDSPRLYITPGDLVTVSAGDSSVQWHLI